MLAPVAFLAVAAGWQAAMVLADDRWIARVATDQRVYRPELGWTDADQLRARRRWARAGLAAAAVVLPATAIDSRVSSGVVVVACLTIVAWLARDRRLHHGRYTSVCIGSLAVSVTAAELVGGAVAGGLASVFAAQLYLVAGVRKLRSPAFMSGRVLFDTVAYALFQAAAGNREFLPLMPAARLPVVLADRRLLSGCRVAAVLTVALELAIGVGAVGLLPPAVTLALAIPLNLAFVALSPRRIVAFSTAAVGLVVLGGSHPLV